MARVIKNGNPEKVAEEVRSAFTKAKIAALKDLKQFEKENKSKVNAKIVELGKPTNGLSDDFGVFVGEDRGEINAKLREIRAIIEHISAKLDKIAASVDKTEENAKRETRDKKFCIEEMQVSKDKTSKRNEEQNTA